MTVIALTSAKGSPGVTTLAHRLADVLARDEELRCGQRPARPVVLVEADPAGGDVAARRGLRANPGLATLALVARRRLDAPTVFDHCQMLGRVRVLTGVAGAQQGAVVAPLVPPIVGTLAELGAIVVLDTGRCGARAGLDGVLETAARVMIVTRTDTGSIVHARSAADSLGAASLEPQLVLVGTNGRSPAEIESAVGWPVVGVIAHSPAEAAENPDRWLIGRRSELARSVADLAHRLVPE